MYYDRSAFAWFNWMGAFPVAYDQRKRTFAASRRGLVIALVHVAVVATEIRRYLIMLFFGAIKKTSAVSAIVLTANGFGLLVVLLRRIVLVNDTVRCYNSLSEWPRAAVAGRKSYAAVFYTAVGTVFVEFVGDNAEKWMRNKPMTLDLLSTYAFIGFEMQLIYTFHIIGQLYSDLNSYVESGLFDDLERIHQARRRNLTLYMFCKKFNSHYNMDLIIHFSCYQLYVLLVLFKFVKNLSSSLETEDFVDSFIDIKIIVRLIRMARLFVVFVYFIDSTSYLHHKSVFTFYYILRSRVNYLRLQTKEQLYLFLNELNATEVTITANNCYDVNKKFLYSVSGSIVAYLVLVVSFLCNRF